MQQPPQTLEAVHPTGTREDARQLIDQEISALEDSIRKLKTRRNLISPINQLPPEILSRIFAFCVTRPIVWVRSVTHVCRLWRAIALDFPQLWRKITIHGFQGGQCAKEMLRRSKMAKLSLTINYPTSQKISRPIQAALSHVERITTLRIRLAGGATSAEQMITLLKSSAPVLSSFSLRSGHLVPPVLIPDNIFNGTTPNLRRLDLRGYYPNWSSPMLYNLTSLKIHAKSTSTTEQLISVLKSLCHLRQLELMGCLPTGDDIAKPPERVEAVVLAHLVEFKIASTILGCTNILSRVLFGPGTMVWVDANCGERVQPDESATRLLRFFSSLASSLDSNAVPFQELLVQIQTWCVVLQMTTKPAARPCDRKNLTVKCSSLPSSRITSYNIIQEVLASGFQSISLGQVVRLSTIGRDEIAPAVWLSCLRRMPNLRSISSANGARNLFAAMRLDLECLITQETRVAGSGRGYEHLSTVVVLPRLQMIYVRGMDFSHLHNGTPFAMLLVDLIIERYERGAVLHTLNLEWCRRIHQTHIDNLEEVIGAVHWDGQIFSARDADDWERASRIPNNDENSGDDSSDDDEYFDH